MESLYMYILEHAPVEPLILVSSFNNYMMSWIRESNWQNKRSSRSGQLPEGELYKCCPWCKVRGKSKSFWAREQPIVQLFSRSLLLPWLSKLSLAKRKTESICSSWLLLLSKMFNSQSSTNPKNWLDLFLTFLLYHHLKRYSGKLEQSQLLRALE